MTKLQSHKTLLGYKFRSIFSEQGVILAGGFSRHEGRKEGCLSLPSERKFIQVHPSGTPSHEVCFVSEEGKRFIVSR